MKHINLAKLVILIISGVLVSGLVAAGGGHGGGGHFGGWLEEGTSVAGMEARTLAMT